MNLGFTRLEPAVLERSGARSAGLTYCVEPKLELLEESSKMHWDQAVEELSGSLYMSHDWLRLWWEFYGDNLQLRLFRFFADGEVVGIIPLFIDTVTPWPLRIRIARLVGAALPPRFLALAIHQDWAQSIFEVIFDELFGKHQCDVLSLGPTADSSEMVEAFLAAAQRTHALVVPSRRVWCDKHTVFPLPKRYEEYLASLDGKERKIRRNKLKELGEAWPVRVEVIKTPGEAITEFERFVSQHTRQWESKGTSGHFHAWPKALKFHRALVSAHGRLGRVRFIRLWAGDEVVANQYAYGFGKTLFAELPSRVAGTEWDRYSLGCTSQVKLIESAINEGFTALDSGLGHYEYKVRLNGQESSPILLHAVGTQVASRCGAALARTVGLSLAYGYHRLWYRRLRRRLFPRSRRPQWTGWRRLYWCYC